MARAAHIPLGPRIGSTKNAQPLREDTPRAQPIRDRGLTREEAQRRLHEVGPNELTARAPPSVILQFLRQFTDITVLALIAAAALAVALGWNQHATLLHRFGDAAAISIIVMMNAIIGFTQERKAERALAALKLLGAPTARVIRSGESQRIASRELVPDDLVELVEGDRVPADARLVETEDLVIDEAALTGESVPVDKLELGELPADTPLAQRTNMVFSGTHVVRGRAKARVVATGMQTELGTIARLLGEVKAPETPLQKSLQRFGRVVVLGCVLIGAFVFLVGALRQHASLPFLLLTSVSLAVAAIPEGLPAISTIVLALGVERMVKKNALIRRLAAVETLGSADLICTDKTGTLTENRMEVRRVFAGGQVFDPASAPETAAFSALITSCGCARGDATDKALLRLYQKFAKDQPAPGEDLRTLPFDRVRRMSTCIRANENGVFTATHGAPEAVLTHSKWLLDEHAEERPLGARERKTIQAHIEQFARAGLRVIALARCPKGKIEVEITSVDREALIRSVERDLVFIGLVGLADPPRVGVKNAISRARAAGVRTLMITGDHPLTAEAIAREIGLLDENAEIVTGRQLDGWSDIELLEHADSISVVARATPANKLRLIDALKTRGHVVAMTGDGVNDAPAIKSANIGVAMGKGGTDVAREAAGMVLLDNDYATIVAAIEQGRIIYGNIQRFIVFLFAVNAGLVIAVFAAALLGWPPILTPTQILWINLITNGLPALALGMEPVHVDPMKRPPRSPGEPLVLAGQWLWLVGYGAVMAALGLGVFGWYRAQGADLTHARTAAFVLLAIAPLFFALASRSLQASLFRLGIGSNWRLLGAFGAALVLEAVAIFAPPLHGVFGTRALGAGELAALFGLSATVWLLSELQKWAFRRLGIRAHYAR